MTNANGILLYYDPFDRLVQVSGTPVTRFTHDGANLVAEWDGADNLQRRYVYAGGELLMQYEGTGVSDRRYFHSDERGSIVATSNSSATVTAVNRYDEYGNPASGNSGRFQYTGQAWIPEAGLYYYRARMYNPRLGRFMQTDPIGYGDGMNMYAYVGGDPVNMIDPSGLSGCTFEDAGDEMIDVCAETGDRPEPNVGLSNAPSGSSGLGNADCVPCPRRSRRSAQLPSPILRGRPPCYCSEYRCRYLAPPRGRHRGPRMRGQRATDQTEDAQETSPKIQASFLFYAG